MYRSDPAFTARTTRMRDKLTEKGKCVILTSSTAETERFRNSAHSWARAAGKRLSTKTTPNGLSIKVVS